MYQIPSYVFLSPIEKNNIKIAQFDVASQRWAVLPNDTVVEYELPEKRVTCKVSKPEPIAYVQDRCADYPYVAWELRTVEEGVVFLDIELKRYMPVAEGEEKKRIMYFFS